MEQEVLAPCDGDRTALIGYFGFVDGDVYALA